ncbi:MAG TPA: RNA-binding cell elongation regulator Jag/EloR [Bacilli bacterium]|nr:RNA-binding cell elongation regulator Jag/EloR [Bacilli bacterium]
MKINSYEGKNKEEALKKALESLNVAEDDVLYRYEELKGKLFKGTTNKITVVLISEIEEFAKEYLKKLLADMGIEATFESKIREKQIYIKMYSNNNPILIGKNGQTLESLQNIIKNVTNNNIGIYPLIVLDVEDYKERQEKRIERLAKNIAKDVARTKIEVKMDSMNSYERRIVHNALTDFKGVYTVSEGEEPNRSVVIKPKEDK